MNNLFKINEDKKEYKMKIFFVNSIYMVLIFEIQNYADAKFVTHCFF